MSYSALALLGVGAAVVLDLFVLRTRLLTRRIFWVSYAIIVFFQLITNGILTGRDIVIYDPHAILGLRIGLQDRVRCVACPSAASAGLPESGAVASAVAQAATTA